MKAVLLHKSAEKFAPGKGLHPISVGDVAIPVPGPGEVLVQIKAAAYNHRDLYLREGLYPGGQFSSLDNPSILGGDGAGVVVAPHTHPLINKPVLVSSAVGWISDPVAPEGNFGILGGVTVTGGRGTFAQYIVVDKDDVVACPEHFVGRGKEGWSEAAAIPLAGLTAWRATFTKAKVSKGMNVLVTGIGGGVALFALQYAVAAGANVYVTSSSPEKIKKAVALGAKGGVSYKTKNWGVALAKLLPADHSQLDAVIDGGGSSVMLETVRILRPGAIVSCYGMTALGNAPVSMVTVLKNIEFRGSTMGSLAEFKAAVAFIAEHKIKPVVDIVLDGLEKAEDGFQIMKNATQFGKITIAIDNTADYKL